VSQVIINEFELVPAPTSSVAEGEPSTAEVLQAENPPARSPVLEAERLMRWHHDRLRRVWAH
jgi:hypothetical protein